jgi:hypothetical protein
MLKRQTIKNYQKYPPTTDCDTIVKMFNNNFSDQTFKDYAKIDKKYTEIVNGTGIF